MDTAITFKEVSSRSPGDADMTGAAGYVAAALDTAPIDHTFTIPIPITGTIRDIGDTASITTMALGTAMDTMVITKTTQMRGSSSPHRGCRLWKVKQIRYPSVVTRELYSVDGRDRD